MPFFSTYAAELFVDGYISRCDWLLCTNCPGYFLSSNNVFPPIVLWECQELCEERLKMHKQTKECLQNRDEMGPAIATPRKFSLLGSVILDSRVPLKKQVPLCSIHEHDLSIHSNWLRTSHPPPPPLLCLALLLAPSITPNPVNKAAISQSPHTSPSFPPLVLLPTPNPPFLK